MRRYKVNEIFYSLQGEGVRTGIAHLFLRLAGCNIHCSRRTHGFDCDTDYADGRPMTADEIIETLAELGADCRWVLLTGGEPALQLDDDLIASLKQAGYRLAIETNGTIALPAGLDWITVSPKVPEEQLAQLTADEVKYVLTDGQPLPRTTVQARHKLLSPAADGTTIDPGAMRWCLQLVRANPDYRLSVQLHKLCGFQ